MPSAVTFNVSISPLPDNWAGTPQDLANAIAERIQVTPAEPWNSFQVENSIPLSDLGPVLYQGVEWRVFDVGLGAYTYHRQNGAGIVAGTVELAALKEGTAHSLLRYNAEGDVSELAIGTADQVLTVVDGAPTWRDLPTDSKYAFRAFKSATSQTFNATSGSLVEQVVFDGELFDDGDAFTNNTFVAPTAGKYRFTAKVHTSCTSGSSTGADRILRLRVNGVDNAWVKMPLGETGGGTMEVNELIQLAEGDVVDAAIEIRTTSSSTWSIANTPADTTFSGYKVSS